MDLLKKLFRSKKRYICSECGKSHDEWPALTFDSPASYAVLSNAQKKAIAEINSDLCIIKHSHQTDRFIRVTLHQAVNDSCRDLMYGVWVTLSEKSFNDYTANYGNDNKEVAYFGYLGNSIPPYDSTINIPFAIFTQKGGQRPYIKPDDGIDHPFVKDFFDGISKDEAERRINAMMNK